MGKEQGSGTEVAPYSRAIVAAVERLGPYPPLLFGFALGILLVAAAVTGAGNLLLVAITLDVILVISLCFWLLAERGRRRHDSASRIDVRVGKVDASQVGVHDLPAAALGKAEIRTDVRSDQISGDSQVGVTKIR